MKKGWKNLFCSVWRRDSWGLNTIFQQLNGCNRDDGDSLQKDAQWQEAIGTSCIRGNPSRCKKKFFNMRATKLWTGCLQKWGNSLEITKLDGPLIISSEVLLSTEAWSRWSPELPSNLDFSIWFPKYQGFVLTRKHKPDKNTQCY